MNAAARLVHQHGLSRHLVLTHLLSRQQIILIGLVMAVILSALSIVYVTNASREMYATYEHHVAEMNRYHSAGGQLLLEKSTWTMQARVQEVAEKKLGMVLPDHQSIVVIRE